MSDNKDDKSTGNHDEDEEHLPGGTLISHLLELRDRIIHAMLAVGLALIPCVMFSNPIFVYIAEPLRAELPPGSAMVATGVWSPFTTPFKCSLFVALLIAMPYVLYQAWAFVAPGLYKHEKRLAVPLLASSILLFYVGIAFAYFIVFRVMFQFVLNQTPEGVKPMTDINQYLDFVLTMFFCFGLAFEVPVAVVLLVLLGLVSSESLQKNRKFVFLGSIVLSAFLTPPDVMSQASLALPLYVLYEGGVLMSRVLTHMKRSGEHKMSET